MQKKYPSVIFSTQTAILWADLVVLCSPIFFLLHNILIGSIHVKEKKFAKTSRIVK